MSSDDLRADPLINDLAHRRPLLWARAGLPPVAEALKRSGISAEVVDRAARRFRWSAPWLAQAFPETQPNGGAVESALQPAQALQQELDARLGGPLRGSLWLTRDDALPISGSIKARGGFHEVLEYAESVAADHGFPMSDSRVFASEKFRSVARAHRVIVGSTGNLGLSIGILGAALGFSVTVHMSTDARIWKKELLRTHGVEVIEHEGPFDDAVAAGRQSAEGDDRAHFVDDEDSVSLFAGYATAGEWVREQCSERDIRIDEDHPLVVYLPCGVGGGPGGVTYGLKQAFGEAVHCVFVEPLEVPSMVLGVRSGRHSGICVQDIGLSGRTAADGLAVARPSRFIGARLQHLIDGYATVSDEVMRAGVGVLQHTEQIAVEPSAAAGLTIPWRLPQARSAPNPPRWVRSEEATHLVWLTGGGMVPETEMQRYTEEGSALAETLSSSSAVYS